MTVCFSKYADDNSVRKKVWSSTKGICICICLWRICRIIDHTGWGHVLYIMLQRCSAVQTAVHSVELRYTSRNAWDSSDVILSIIVTAAMLEVYSVVTCNVVNLRTFANCCVRNYINLRSARLRTNHGIHNMYSFPQFNSFFLITLSIPPTWRR